MISSFNLGLHFIDLESLPSSFYRLGGGLPSSFYRFGGGLPSSFYRFGGLGVFSLCVWVFGFIDRSPDPDPLVRIQDRIDECYRDHRVGGKGGHRPPQYF